MKLTNFPLRESPKANLAFSGQSEASKFQTPNFWKLRFAYSKKSFASSKLKPAFSLIELLVVVAIIGIISSIIAANVTNHQRKARDSQRKKDLGEFKKAMTAARNDCQGSAFYPTITPSADAKADYNSLATNLSATGVKYIRVVLKDPKTNDTNFGYEFYPDLSPTSNACASLANTDGITKFTLRAKLENTNDPDSQKSFTACSGSPSMSSFTNDGQYYYVCGK